MVGNRPIYPCGLATLADSMRRCGHQVEIVDFVHDPEKVFTTTWLDISPDIIGLSIRDIDPIDIVSPSFVGEYVKFVEILKQAILTTSSRPLLVGGGAGFSLFPEQLADRLGIKVVVVGPGESALREICDNVESYRNVQRLTILNIPDYEFGEAAIIHKPELITAYLNRAVRSEIGVQTRRRICVKKCSYCPYSYIDGNFVGRSKPIEVLAQELTALYGQGVRNIFFADAIFNDNLPEAKAICRMLTRLNLNGFTWSAYFVPSNFDMELGELLSSSGLTTAVFSPDSFDETIIRRTGKLFTMKHVRAARKICRENGVSALWALLFGLPFESRDTVKTTLNVARSEFSIDEVNMFVGVRILPGTPISRQMELTDSRILFPTFYPIHDWIFDTMIQKYSAFWAGERFSRYFAMRSSFQMMERVEIQNKLEPDRNYVLVRPQQTANIR